MPLDVACARFQLRRVAPVTIAGHEERVEAAQTGKRVS